MEIVGARFAADEYYLSELIGAADIFKKVSATLGDTIKPSANETIATAALRDQVTILIGGGPMDQAVADYVGPTSTA